MDTKTKTNSIGTKSNAKKSKMLKELEGTMGIVTTAANKVGIRRETHYQWIKSDPDYAEAVEALNNVALDFAEERIHELIRKGDTAATIFFLKCKGKHRGYTERQELQQTVEAKTKSYIEFAGQKIEF